MQKLSLKKTEGISLKRLKNSQNSKKLTLNILQTDNQQAQNTSTKRTNSFDHNLSSKRTKTTLHTRARSNIQELSSKQNNPQLHHKTMPAKFCKLPLNNPICMKHDQKVQKLVEEITPKSQCFYKFGFKSYQKPSHKRMFSEMLNLSKQEMKGMLFIGELWNNQMTNKFMKANNVNLSKRKFFEKLRDMKWQKVQKQKQRIMDSRQLINSVRQFNQRSQRSIPSLQQLESLLSIGNFTLKNIQQDQQNSVYQSEAGSRKSCRKQERQEISKTLRLSLEKIRNSIDQEFKQNKKHQEWKMMKSLQKQSSQIHNLWDRYFAKMVQNQ